MKIHQLPLGASFEYEGEAYVKTGPLFGTGRHGQKLIPKYAVLKILGEAAPVAAQSEKLLSRKLVLEAFDSFHACCETLVQADKQSELSVARDAFMKSIG